MDRSVVRLLVYGLLALAVVGVALSVETFAVVVASAVVAAVVAVFVHRWLARSDRDESATPAATADDEADAWIGHLRSLVRLNIMLRENDLPAETIAQLEQSVDVLRRLIPELNEDYRGSELTWTVNRMATDYLPRIVTPYAALSPAAREEHEAEFSKSLRGLEAELDNIVNLVRGSKVGEFKAKAAFLRARFLDADLG